MSLWRHDEYIGKAGLRQPCRDRREHHAAMGLAEIPEECLDADPCCPRNARHRGVRLQRGNGRRRLRDRRHALPNEFRASVREGVIVSARSDALDRRIAIDAIKSKARVVRDYFRKKRELVGPATDETDAIAAALDLALFLLSVDAPLDSKAVLDALV